VLDNFEKIAWPPKVQDVLAPLGRSEKSIDEQTIARKRSVDALDWTTTTQRNYNLRRVREICAVFGKR